MKIGSMTFGGGYAMLPLLEREIVEKQGWSTREELLDYFAIGQITPGIISVNTATFIGYKQKGILGGIIATFGLILPSILIILGIAQLLDHFSEYAVVGHAFAGIQVGVAVIMVLSLKSMSKSALKNRFAWIIFGIVLFCMVVFQLSPILVIIGVLTVAILDYMIGGKL